MFKKTELNSDKTIDISPGRNVRYPAIG